MQDFSRFEFSPLVKIGILISSAGLNNLGWLLIIRIRFGPWKDQCLNRAFLRSLHNRLVYLRWSASPRVTTTARIRRKHPVFGIKLNLLSCLQWEPNVFSSYVHFAHAGRWLARVLCSYELEPSVFLGFLWRQCRKKVYVPLGSDRVWF